MTSYAIRVDEDLKEGAANVARSFGLDLASVTRAFWTYMVRTGSIPITFDGEQPNEESLEAIRETGSAAWPPRRPAPTSSWSTPTSPT